MGKDRMTEQSSIVYKILIIIVIPIFFSGCITISEIVDERRMNNPNKYRTKMIEAIRTGDNNTLVSIIDEVSNSRSKTFKAMRIPQHYACGTLLHYSVYYNNMEAFNIIYDFYKNWLNRKLSSSEWYKSTIFHWIQYMDIHTINNISDIVNVPDCATLYNFHPKVRAIYRDKDQELIYYSTPLMVASEYGKVEFVQYLLELGASINKKDIILHIEDKYKEDFYNNKVSVISGYLPSAIPGLVIDIDQRKISTKYKYRNALEYALLADRHKATVEQRKQIMDILLRPIKKVKDGIVPKTITVMAKSTMSDEALRQSAKNLGEDIIDLTEAYIRYRYWRQKIEENCAFNNQIKKFLDAVSTGIDILNVGKFAWCYLTNREEEAKSVLKNCSFIKQPSLLEFALNETEKGCKKLEKIGFMPIEFWLGFDPPPSK